MKRFAALATLISSAFWVNAASAACVMRGWFCIPVVSGGGGSGGGVVTPSPAPEIDVSSALAAVVLLITVGAIVYHRWQRR